MVSIRERDVHTYIFMVFIIAQIFGVMGMALNIVSYFQKKQRSIILFQLVAAFLWIIHYVLLGIATDTFYIACLLNGLGLIRAVVYSNKEKFHAESNVWLLIFVILYITSYVLTFTVFKKPPVFKNFIVEFLPVIALTANTIGFKMKTSLATRLANLVNSPCWLIYSIINSSLGGIIGEVLTFSATIIGIFKYEYKKKS